MSRYIGFFPIIFLLLTSCKFNPNLQGKGTDYLQGVWAEDSVSYRDQLLQYTKHHYKFTCDSFYTTLTTFAKTNMYPDSCFNEGKWTEYAKGNYTVKGDSLVLSGTFTKSNFKQKISGCYRIGLYLETFIIKDKPGKTIHLQSVKQHRPVYLTLKQKTVCIQQPIN